nr:leucine zipper domain-containing protein [Microvirga massiliensis]
MLARRCGVSTETIGKWCKRGAEGGWDRSSRPHKPPWKTSEEERAIVPALRRATDFRWSDLRGEPHPATSLPRCR